MLIYFGMAALVLILALLGEYTHRAHASQRPPGAKAVPRRLTTSYFDLLAVGVLVVFSGLRYEVGSDYKAYYRIYEYLDTSDWAQAIADSPQEFGFTALMLGLKSMTESPLALFWACAVLTVIPVYSVLVKRSSLPPLAIALFIPFVYVSSFNVMRQSVAIALLFWAWSHLDKRKFLFFAIAAVAATIHVSAIFAVVILLIARKLKWSWGTAIGIGSTVVILAAVMGQTTIVSNLASRFNPRYGAYLDSGATGIGSYLQILAFVLLLVFAVTLNASRNPLTATDKQLAILSLIGIGAMLAGTQALVVFRMSDYFAVFLVLLVSNRVAGSRDSLLVGFLLVCGAAAFLGASLANYGEVVPYKTYATF